MHSRACSAFALITLLTLTNLGGGSRPPAQLLQTAHTAPAVPNDPLVDKFRKIKQLTSQTWQPVDTIELKHPVYHPQGMVKIGNNFFISAVQILERTEKFSYPVAEGQPDRTQGSGTGHLFKFDRSGALVDEITLGEKESRIYHPGGIDYDGQNIWVAVAQYRPHSQSIIYRVNPKTLEYQEVFRVRDHIGGVVFDRQKRVLHGVSWGSRDFYTWSPQGEELNHRVNGSYYVDYQDCQFVPARFMLCSGTKNYSLPGVGMFAFGGLELVDLASHTPIHQVPVLLYPDEENPEVVLTRNSMFAELEGGSIRFYFLPEDSLPRGEKPACSEESSSTSSRIYVYRVRAQ